MKKNRLKTFGLFIAMGLGLTAKAQSDEHYKTSQSGYAMFRKSDMRHIPKNDTTAIGVICRKPVSSHYYFASRFSKTDSTFNGERIKTDDKTFGRVIYVASVIRKDLPARMVGYDRIVKFLGAKNKIKFYNPNDVAQTPPSSAIGDQFYQSANHATAHAGNGMAPRRYPGDWMLGSGYMGYGD